MRKVKKLILSIKSLNVRARNAFDIRDFFVLSGLAMLGYGLYIRDPWVAYVVCGPILMIIGYIMRPPE